MDETSDQGAARTDDGRRRFDVREETRRRAERPDREVGVRVRPAPTPS